MNFGQSPGLAPFDGGALAAVGGRCTLHRRSIRNLRSGCLVTQGTLGKELDSGRWVAYRGGYGTVDAGRGPRRQAAAVEPSPRGQSPPADGRRGITGSV